jgi:hypothetical protein
VNYVPVVATTVWAGIFARGYSLGVAIVLAMCLLRRGRRTALRPAGGQVAGGAQPEATFGGLRSRLQCPGWPRYGHGRLTGTRRPLSPTSREPRSSSLRRSSGGQCISSWEGRSVGGAVTLRHCNRAMFCGPGRVLSPHPCPHEGQPKIACSTRACRSPDRSAPSSQLAEDGT